MDFYNFIDSKDIREYMRKTEYRFTSIEAAFIVWQSKAAALIEKHAAWKYIIAAMLDNEIAERPNTVYRVSLHEYLKELMCFENKVLGILWQEESDAVYAYSIFIPDDNVWIEFKDSIYSSYEICLENAVIKCLDFVDESSAGNAKISIKKMWINEVKKKIEVCCTANGNIMYFVEYGDLDEYERDLVFSGFDGMWFAFPVPFQRGDILQIQGCDVFVLEEIASEGEFRNRLELYGDTSDMAAYGYFIDSKTGKLFHNNIYNYLYVEKYVGTFDDNLQRLRLLSLFMKGEIDPVEYIDYILRHYDSFERR